MACTNIYFSGSIKGGRQLVDNYRIMIQTLAKYGKVLTEHIGDSNYASGGYTAPDIIYSQDKAWLDDSHIVLADVTLPSLGVGYELAYAEAKGIPVVCLYQEGATVSSMILGNGNFYCVSYDDIAKAVEIIDRIMIDFTNKGE